MLRAVQLMVCEQMTHVDDTPPHTLFQDCTVTQPIPVAGTKHMAYDPWSCSKLWCWAPHSSPKQLSLSPRSTPRLRI